MTGSAGPLFVVMTESCPTSGPPSPSDRPATSAGRRAIARLDGVVGDDVVEERPVRLGLRVEDRSAGVLGRRGAERDVGLDRGVETDVIAGVLREDPLV